MPSMEYLLGEISVDGPEHREEAIKFNAEPTHKGPGLPPIRKRQRTLSWPEGWWAVSDDQFAYLGFFQFEEDAWAYRLYLVNLRMNAKAGRRRYREADKGIEEEEDHAFKLQEGGTSPVVAAFLGKNAHLMKKPCPKDPRSRTSPSASKAAPGRSRGRTGTTTS